MEQTSSLNKVLKVVFVVNLVVLNVLVGYLVYKSQIQNSKIQINPNNQNPIIKTETVDICGPDCQKYIDASLKSQIPSSKSTPTPISTKVVYQQTPAKKVRTVTYVPIPGTGSTMNNGEPVSIPFTVDERGRPFAAHKIYCPRLHCRVEDFLDKF